MSFCLFLPPQNGNDVNALTHVIEFVYFFDGYVKYVQKLNNCSFLVHYKFKDMLGEWLYEWIINVRDFWVIVIMMGKYLFLFLKKKYFLILSVNKRDSCFFFFNRKLYNWNFFLKYKSQASDSYLELLNWLIFPPFFLTKPLF